MPDLASLSATTAVWRTSSQLLAAYTPQNLINNRAVFSQVVIFCVSLSTTHLSTRPTCPEWINAKLHCRSQRSTLTTDIQIASITLSNFDSRRNRWAEHTIQQYV